MWTTGGLVSAGIEGRLRKAEQVVGAAGKCSCERKVAIYYEGERQPSKACPVCGGERQFIHVVFERPALKRALGEGGEGERRLCQLRKYADQQAEAVGAGNE
jgi:hypothetical protein